MIIRDYDDDDEAGWLRCRLLSFFDTAYYDDVKVERTPFVLDAIRLVADVDGVIAGLIDIEVDGAAATIDSIAVHPDHRRAGLATALLREGLARLPAGVTTLDAWTREDEAALRWYTANSFTEEYRYLHVYKGYHEPDDGFTTPPPLSAPVIAFCHAPIEHEAELRARYHRVYVCRQFVLQISPASTD
jgi:ribosomal protein S18 acetylase RimI-like enzyme